MAWAEHSVLIIGDGDSSSTTMQIPWEAVPDLVPSVLQFSTVLVIPAPGTQEKQKELLAILKADIAAAGPASRVIWILNRHTIPTLASLPVKCRCGCVRNIFIYSK